MDHSGIRKNQSRKFATWHFISHTTPHEMEKRCISLWMETSTSNNSGQFGPSYGSRNLFTNLSSKNATWQFINITTKQVMEMRCISLWMKTSKRLGHFGSSILINFGQIGLSYGSRYLLFLSSDNATWQFIFHITPIIVDKGCIFGGMQILINSGQVGPSYVSTSLHKMCSNNATWQNIPITMIQEMGKRCISYGMETSKKHGHFGSSNLIKFKIGSCQRQPHKLNVRNSSSKNATEHCQRKITSKVMKKRWRSYVMYTSSSLGHFGSSIRSKHI